MKRNFFIFIIIFGVSLGVFFNIKHVQAQTEQERIAELQRQIDELENQASQYRTSIASEQAKAESLKRDIAILQNEIKRLETQISITSKKIDKTKLEITSTEGDIFNLIEDIRHKKEMLTRLILFVHQQDQENLVATLIKNRDLSDFFRQGQYASSVSDQIVGLTDELQLEKDSLENNKNNLEQKEQDLQELNAENALQKNSLNGTKQSKDQLLKKTKGQEAEYQKMLAEVERKKAIFFQELKGFEANAILGGKFIIHVTADSVPPAGTKLFQWPESNYRVTQGYGMTKYARRGAYGGAPHNGLDIVGGFGSEIRSIGDGEIVSNGQNDGWGNWVAVKHPNNMVSVYAHMSAFALLKVGTPVTMGQVIGYEGSTGNSSGSHLHLSLYSNFFTYIKDKNGQLYFNYFEGSLNPLDYL